MLIPAVTLFLERPGIRPGVITTGQLVGINGLNLTASAAPLAIPVIYAVSTLKVSVLSRVKWFYYAFYTVPLTLLWLLKFTL